MIFYYKKWAILYVSLIINFINFWILNWNEKICFGEMCKKNESTKNESKLDSNMRWFVVEWNKKKE